MAALENKIDFVALISVTNANCNGDPLNGNRPRTDYNGMGEISDVCIKRKLRNRMQDMGYAIFVQSDDRCDDGCKSLSDRAAAATKGIKDRSIYAQTACEKWMDVRSFGQVFAFKSTDKNGVSVGVRGPVSIHQAVSISPVEIEEMQITKSVNGETGEKRASDTMGMKRHQCATGGKDRFYPGGCRGHKRMSADAVRKRCVFCPAGGLHGGGEALLVGAQLQGRAVFLGQGTPQRPCHAQKRGGPAPVRG